MSTQRNNNGGHAFPTLFIDPEHGSGYAGMSLRDWFAGQIAGEVYTTQMDTEQSIEGIYAVYKFDPIATAEKAYAFADAMIAARKKDYTIDRGENK